MTDVFVSYARQDRDRIAPLVRALEARCLEVWWDSRIAGGTEFRKEIEAQLEAAGAVLVVWSRHSIESLWVADEASARLERGKLVPISIDPVPPRIGFRQLQTLDFVNWKQDPSDPCVARGSRQ
ncbi:MAG TPA: toll/interleukin-1 receptor domain-containing protein [Azoarcus taiwanensis]|nr:toll/interleukin-1 receptor domain-containing protein [Azoarcus taiwanensis]